MPSFFRTINYRRWEQRDWLSAGELQSASLKDLKTVKSSLSVYLTDPDVGIDRIVAALASAVAKDKVAQVDYVLLDFKWLEERGYRFSNTPDRGLTLDRDVNQLHFDLQGLTTFELYDLALHMSPLIRAEGPIIRDQVAKLIDESIALCHIDERRLNEKLLKNLRNLRKKRKQRK